MGLVSVWMEGYSCTGNHCDAQLVGTVEAEDFADACNKLALQNPERSWNDDNTAIWGCRLFDNETDARKGFG